VQEIAQASTRSETVVDGSPSRLLTLLLLGLAAWAGSYARFALSPLQEAMRAALGLTDNQIAVAQGPAIAVAIMAGSIPLGLLVDRYSRVRLLAGFVMLNLAGSVLTAVSSDFFVLLVARCLVGLMAVAALIAIPSLVADLYAPEQRGRASIAVSGGSDLGSPAAFAIGGALLATHGADPDGWRWSMFVMTAPALLVVILLLLTLKEPPRTDQVTKNPPIRVAIAKLWRYRAVITPLLAARCMVWLADGATIIWGAPFFTRRFDLPPDRIGAIMAAVLLAAGLAAPVAGGFLADVCQRSGGPRCTMLALSGLALLSLPASLLAFGVADAPLVAGGLLVAFVTLGFMTNMTGGILATIVIPNEVRGTYLSVSMVVGCFFGIAVAPLLVSALSGAFGGPEMIGKALAVVCVGASAVGAVIFALGSRAFPRSAARRRTNGG
jgi:MFS family permease